MFTDNLYNDFENRRFSKIVSGDRLICGLI